VFLKGIYSFVSVSVNQPIRIFWFHALSLSRPARARVTAGPDRIFSESDPGRPVSAFYPSGLNQIPPVPGSVYCAAAQPVT